MERLRGHGDRAPKIACTVKVSWTGQTVIEGVADGPDGQEDLSALLDQQGQESESAGSKNIYDEAPEVQDFLRELYNSGLTQSNSDYDLSYFDGQGPPATPGPPPRRASWTWRACWARPPGTTST